MRFRPRQIGLVAGLLALLAVVSCSPPDGRPDTGPDTEWTPDVDGADSSDGDDEWDGSGGDLTLTMGRSGDDRESWEPYPDEGAEIQLIHGFQGGYHVEPALFVTGIESAEFTTTINYHVERIEDGEQLNRRETYNIDQYGWMSHEGGHLHHSNPVVFQTRDPDEVLGDEVRMEVTVDVEGGGKVKSVQKGTLVDGGRP